MSVSSITKSLYQPPRINIDTRCVLAKLLKQNSQFAKVVDFLRLAATAHKSVVLPGPLFTKARTKELFFEMVLKNFCPIKEGGLGKYYGRTRLSWLEWEDLIKNLYGGFSIMMFNVQNRTPGCNVLRALDEAADMLAQLKITEDYLIYFPEKLPRRLSPEN
jgi:hypothetical protein